MKIKILLFIIIFIGCSESINNNIDDKPLDLEKIELGKRLFFEKRLSDTDSISCGSCHSPLYSFSDNKPLSRGIFNRKGTRNSPALINLITQKSFFWDGRAKSLEEQMNGPMTHAAEMGNTELNIEKIKSDTAYIRLFNHIYNGQITLSNTKNAIAEFEKSLHFKKSPIDDFINGDTLALNDDQKRGYAIFKGKANCIVCHSGDNFTDGEFHNIGFFDPKLPSDSGRVRITKQSKDLGKFKTPSLRNISLSAPYFHDGKVETLREIIELYSKPNPMGEGINKDIKLRRINLSEIEKYQLLQFLLSLTSFEELSKFTSISSLKERHESQNVSKFEYEKTAYLPTFDDAIRYLKIFETDDYTKLKNVYPQPWSDSLKVILFKTHIYPTIGKELDQGKHMLFKYDLNQYMALVKTVHKTTKIRINPLKIESKSDLESAIQTIEKIKKDFPEISKNYDINLVQYLNKNKTD